LAAVLPERNTPELLYLESKFAGLVSYGQSAELLAEMLPLGRQLHASAVRLHALATGTRLESELGPEQAMFAKGCQSEWDEEIFARVVDRPGVKVARRTAGLRARGGIRPRRSPQRERARPGGVH
jgi:hypothetical protein